MKRNRRTFLQVAGTFSAGSLLLPQLACNTSTSTDSENKKTTTAKAPKKIDQFGIQLWTLRDVMPKDPKGVLKRVASYGFHQIESYEGDQGIFWGMTPKDFKLYMDDLGLNVVASHCNIFKDFELKASQAASVGIKYLVFPWIETPKSMDEWKSLVDQFNICGGICKKNGIRFGYHNHDFEFMAIDGTLPMDYLLANTDPDLVDFEMDIYWAVTAQVDPVAYFKKHSGRFRLCHIKDRMKGVAKEETNASCDLGTGVIDFPQVLTQAKKHGMEYFLLEQERYDNSTSLKSAQVGAAYLRDFEFVG